MKNKVRYVVVGFPKRLEARYFDNLVRVTVGDPNVDVTFDVRPLTDGGLRNKESLAEIVAKTEQKRFRVTIEEEDQ